MAKLVLLLLLTAVCVGCFDAGSGKNMSDLAPQAVEIGNRFYGHLQRQAVDSAYNLLGVPIQEKADKEIQPSVVTAVQAQHGTIKSYNLSDTKYAFKYRNGQGKKNITICYDVQYGDGYLSKENLVFNIMDTTTVIQRIDSYNTTGDEQDD